MKRGKLLGTLAMLVVLVVAGVMMVKAASSPQPEITVYKSPTCGCCSKWITHLEKNGFKVKAVDMADMGAIKKQFSVKGNLTSCHTGVVNGYVVEGHVPAADIKRMLKDKPAIAGIAVPGMPMGSPGMEGAYTEKYDVLAFTKAGGTSVFAKH